MKISNILIIGLLLLALISCGNIQKDSNKKALKATNDYIKWKGMLLEDLVAHFPVELPNNTKSYSSGFRDNPQNIKYLILLKELTEEEKSKYGSENAVPDSCIFKIYQYKNEYGFNYHAHGRCQMLFPVPEMKLISKEAPITSHIDYYVLEARNSVLHDSDSYLRHYLPDEWKNGVSRGVGISYEEDLIFYWLLMW